jgi:hypothetical protein
MRFPAAAFGAPRFITSEKYHTDSETRFKKTGLQRLGLC